VTPEASRLALLHFSMLRPTASACQLVSFLFSLKASLV
jgi:hypothetical protein